MPEEIIRNEVVRPGIRVTEMVNRVSWGAIWAGIMAALGMEALFSVFGLFVGFGMYHAGAANPWAGVSTWSFVWYLITAAWSMFFGAWCAALLCGDRITSVRVMHGIATWGLSTLVTIAVAVLASWALLKEGISIGGAVTAPNAEIRAAQAAVGNLSGIALRIWIGVLLGLITAIIGGVVGRSRTIAVVTTEVPAGTRIAA